MKLSTCIRKYASVYECRAGTIDIHQRDTEGKEMVVIFLCREAAAKEKHPLIWPKIISAS